MITEYEEHTADKLFYYLSSYGSLTAMVIIVGCLFDNLYHFRQAQCAPTHDEERPNPPSKSLSLIFCSICIAALLLCVQFAFLRNNLISNQSPSTFSHLQCCGGFYFSFTLIAILNVLKCCHLIDILHLGFQDSIYKYSRSTYQALYSCLLLGALIFIIALFLTVPHSTFYFEYIESRDRVFCATKRNQYANHIFNFAVILFVALLITYDLLLLLLFTDRLYKLQSEMVNQHFAEMNRFKPHKSNQTIDHHHHHHHHHRRIHVPIAGLISLCDLSRVITNQWTVDQTTEIVYAAESEMTTISPSVSEITPNATHSKYTALESPETSVIRDPSTLSAASKQSHFSPSAPSSTFKASPTLNPLDTPGGNQRKTMLRIPVMMDQSSISVSNSGTAGTVKKRRSDTGSQMMAIPGDRIPETTSRSSFAPSISADTLVESVGPRTESLRSNSSTTLGFTRSLVQSPFSLQTMDFQLDALPGDVEESQIRSRVSELGVPEGRVSELRVSEVRVPEPRVSEVEVDEVEPKVLKKLTIESVEREMKERGGTNAERIFSFHALIKRSTVLSMIMVLSSVIWLALFIAVNEHFILLVIFPTTIHVVCLWLMFASSKRYWECLIRYGPCWVFYCDKKRDISARTCCFHC